MNVLFLVHYPELYGSIRSLLDLAAGLKQFGIVPHFLLPAKGGLSDILDQSGSKYAILKTEHWVSEIALSFAEKYRIFQKLSTNSDQIGDYLERWSIDLVYTNTIVSPAGLIAARRNQLPHIWHIREFGDLDFGLRFIYPKPLCKIFIRRSDAIICHSKAVTNHHFKPGVKNVYQIYNGVALKDQFDKRLSHREKYFTDRPFTFLMMSSITPKKGQEVAIRALAALRDQGVLARLLIGGNGKADYLEYLLKLCNELDVEAQVEFTGFIENPSHLYYKSDCVLICSEDEAFSRVGLEAMSTALPLIGKNSGGNAEIIKHGFTGLLYNSFEDLVTWMNLTVQNLPKTRQMGLDGWRFARDLFNIEDYAANVYRVIQSVMENR